MTRRLRVHVPGGIHHVTLRGNHQQPIFFADADRDLLDGIVGRAVEKYGLRIHAYCWMTNHLHLLVQVFDAPLGLAIGMIASQYARKMQQALETTGHFFERRFHARFVDADCYLLTLLRYIHRNPVEAGLARDPVQYRWSSHRNYLGLAGQPWVTTAFGLRMLGATRERAKTAYLTLVDAARPDDDAAVIALLRDADADGILGDDEFRQRVLGWRRPRGASTTLDAHVAECCRRSGIDEAEVVGPSRSRALGAIRASLAHEATTQRIASLSAVARRLNRSEGALRQLVARHRPGKRCPR